MTQRNDYLVRDDGHHAIAVGLANFVTYPIRIEHNRVVTQC